jgi:DNA helicase-2/ATP-dependent DNA helicase PcrA
VSTTDVSPPLSGLSPEQRDAVTHPGGPLLVVAGAGAGKTRVLTHRLAWLVEGGVEPGEILALTFSSQAADELRSRAEALIGRAHETLRVSTFHAYAGELARVHGVDHGLLPPAVWATEEDRALMLLERIGELDLVAHDLRGDPGRVVGEILRRIDRCKNELVAADDFVAFAEVALRNAAGSKERRERLRDLEFARAYQAHDRWLAEAGLVDYGEAIVRSLNLLRAHPDRLAAVREVTRHVMIDEFQDTDHAQAQLLYLLADSAESVVAVGDDDQGIYRFRGASTKNIADFRARYPNRREIKLELNHRSTQLILDAAHAVVERVPDRADKRLAALPDAEGPAPAFWVAQDEDAQARAVADEILRLAAQGIPLEEQAILMDSVRTEAPAIVRALESHGISHQVHGGLGLFERREVRAALAWLRALADPHDAQAHLRLVADSDLEMPWAASAAAVAAAVGAGEPVTGALLAVAGPESKFAAAFDAVGPVITGPAQDLVREVLDRSGLRRRALALGGAEGASRLAGLSAFERLADDIARRDRDLDAPGLVKRLVGLSEVGHRGRVERSAERIGVQVSTIHQSKGLEFDVVFVIGFVASRLPGRDRPHSDIPDELLPETIQRGRDAHVAEKRRLTYVAMTRARRHLYLSTFEMGERVRQRPSPFFEDAREALGNPDADRVGASLDGIALAEVAAARDALERAGRAAAAALAEERQDASSLREAARAALDELLHARARAMLPAPPPAVVSPSPAAPPAIDISPSDLATYRTCPLRFRFVRVDRIPQRDRPGGRIGTAAHLALEAHYRPGGEGGDGQALVARFEAQVKRLGVADTPEGQQAIRRGRDQLLQYHERVLRSGSTPAGVERRFTLPLGRHTVRGRVDRIDRHPSGGFQLIDYKTGRPPGGSGVGDEDLVLALYLEAARAGGAKIQGARLEYVLDGDSRVFDPDPAELATLVEDARLLADAAASGAFDPRPGWHCESCDFQLLCPARDR